MLGVTIVGYGLKGMDTLKLNSIYIEPLAKPTWGTLSYKGTSCKMSY